MTGALRLSFTKGAGRTDLVVLTHADGHSVRIGCPKQQIIPHDMVHFAVEAELGKRGFLRRVRAGEAADRRMAGTPESDAVERLVEVMQADGWSPGANAGWLIELYRVTCAARDCPMLPIDANVIHALRVRIAALEAAWKALPVGGTLELTLDD